MLAFIYKLFDVVGYTQTVLFHNNLYRLWSLCYYKTVILIIDHWIIACYS